MITETDLILHSDGSVYHLHLLPEDIAPTVILVGDPDRVPLVSSRFDSIELRKHKREFHTHTGRVGTKRISVVSTGIGTDNIDIVLNELDALVNIDLAHRSVKAEHTQLSLIRIGTSGALQADVPVDSILISSYGLGLDGLMNFYDYEPVMDIEQMLDAIDEQLSMYGIHPYLFKSPGELFHKFQSAFLYGITASCNGFYGPQGRMMRAHPMYADMIERLAEVTLDGEQRLTNFEMETAGIYGLASVLGHEAISVNAIVANRARQQFSHNPEKTIEEAIDRVFEMI